MAAKILAEVNAVLGECGLLLTEGSAVDVNLIAVPSSTNNKHKARDPEMHSNQKAKQWLRGMRTHMGADVAQLAWCMPCAAPVAINMTSPKCTGCFTGMRSLSGRTLGIKVLTGVQALTPKIAWHMATRPGKRTTLKAAGLRHG